MTRVVLGLAIIVAWALVIGGALYMLTPGQVAQIQSDTELALTSYAFRVQSASLQVETRLLDRTTDAAAALALGSALDRLVPPPAAPTAKKPKKGQPSDALTPEQAIDFITSLEAQLTEALEPTWQAAVIDRKGIVVISVGDSLQLGTEMRNYPLVQDALFGVARLGADTFGKTRMLLAVAPTIGRDGNGNGALLVARPLDQTVCNEIATLSAVPNMGLSGVCATGALNGKAVAPGSSVIAQAATTVVPLIFVDPAIIGISVRQGPQTMPLVGAPISVGEDRRPAWESLAERHQELIAFLLGCLLVVVGLVLLASMLASHPATVIANHLALIHQGGKVAPLQERKFSGAYKRIAKNLNTLLEKPAARQLQPTLQPISQLLQSQEEPEMRFDAQGQGTLSGQDDRTVQKKVDPSQLAALRESAKNAPAMSQTLPPLELSDPKPPPTPSALQSLFDDGQQAQQPQALPPMPQSLLDDDRPSALPPLPDLSPSPAQSVPPPNVSLSNDLDTTLKNATIPVPTSAPAFPDTPWGNEDHTTIGPPPTFGGDPDEAHFKEVFQQFLKVRAECNEPVDNLTYDKFVEKLKKSREQVMQKQNTRSVRFQVYVKEGKAALKAIAAK